MMLTCAGMLALAARVAMALSEWHDRGLVQKTVATDQT